LKPEAEVDLAAHVFGTSANMSAASLALVGIFRILTHLRGVAIVGQSILIIATLSFIAATLTSYIAIRSRTRRRLRSAERIADGLFLMGVLLLASVCLMATIEVL
jgi:hypothetical protein